MNKIYKIIWNATRGAWQVVSEFAKGYICNIYRIKLSKKIDIDFMKLGRKQLVTGFAILPISVYAAIHDLSLPTGANITSGSANISQNNNVLNITQTTQNLNTNWHSFNIGKDASVNFIQPNISAVAVNHILDINGSQIMGRLNANGQVFLHNPNGIIFSKTAQVNVGGLVASTLALKDLQSNQSKNSYSLNGNPNSVASVENHGTINTLSGGTVALIAPNVINSGDINTPNGVTHLTSANQVTLAFQDGSLTEYQVNQGVLSGLVNNGGAVIAENGGIYLTAKALNTLSKSVVNHSGILEANRVSQNAKGEIILLADIQVGIATVFGEINAKGLNNQDGGFIETSANNVQIYDSVQVSTLSDTAKTGTWLIDPTDFTINVGSGVNTSSGIGAVTLENSLSNNNVTLMTAATGVGKGDINVDASVAWNKNILKLNAHNNININAEMYGSGTAGLVFEYGQGAVSKDNYSTYNIHAPINLASTGSFNTKHGSDGVVVDYTIITNLGAENSITGKDLQGINGNLNAHYVLGKDIDASATVNWNAGKGFNPIGMGDVNNTEDTTRAFIGDFDGLGHSINGLTVNRTNEANYAGLFGMTANNKISNLALIGGMVQGKTYTGGLVGYNYKGIINNVYNTGDVTSSNSSADYNSYAYAGGLVGQNTDGAIEDAYATGNVFSSNSSSNSFSYSYAYAGGLVGQNTGGTIGNVNAIGDVSSSVFNPANSYSYAGGLIGSNLEGLINHAYAKGSVSSTSSKSSHFSSSYAGGLVGFNRQASINQVYALGDVTSSNSSFTSASSYAGGLVGYNYSDALISNAYAVGNVISDSDDSKAYAGGLVGYNDALVTNAYATGEVTSSSLASSYAGGLVGLHIGKYEYGTSATSSTAKITNSYSTGEVKAYKNDVIDNTYAGGLVGSNTQTNYEKGAIENSYWNHETTRLINSGADISTENLGVTSLTTSEMKNGTNFTFIDANSYLGGENTIWRMYEGHAAPLLRSFLKRVDIEGVNDKLIRNYDGTAQAGGYKVSVTSPNQLDDPSLIMSNHIAAGQNISIDLGKDLYSVQQGYDLVMEDSKNIGIMSIDKAKLTVKIKEPISRIYDNTVVVDDSMVTLDIIEGQLFGSDQLDDSGEIYQFENQNSGRNKKINSTKGAIFVNSENGDDNYAVTFVADTKHEIRKANLVLGVQDNYSREYNSNNDASESTLTFLNNTQLFGNDTISSSNKKFNDSNVDIANQITISDVIINNDNNIENYNIQYVSNNTAKITPKKLTLTDMTAIDRTYDGSQIVSMQGGKLNGLVGTENLNITQAIGRASQAGVGENLAVIITGVTLTDATGKASNYSLIPSSTDVTVNITKAKIESIKGLQAVDRDYNSSLMVDIDPSKAQLIGVIQGDDIYVSHAKGEMQDKHAGRDKVVNINDIQLAGNSIVNYELIADRAQSKVNIGQASIDKITGLLIQPDKQVVIDSQNTLLHGKFLGDDVYVKQVVTEQDLLPITTTQVPVRSVVLAGSDAQNYKVTDTNIMAQVQGEILNFPVGYERAIQHPHLSYIQPVPIISSGAVKIESIGDGVNTSGIQVFTGY